MGIYSQLEINLLPIFKHLLQLKVSQMIGCGMLLGNVCVPVNVKQ